MAAGVIRPSWTSEERASYGATTTGDSLMELVSAVANEELPDPRKEFLSLGEKGMNKCRIKRLLFFL